MFDGMAYDDSDFPAIGLVPLDASWDDILDHIKIAHDFLLIQPGGDGCWTGAYWADSEMVVVEGLGPNEGEALEEFRQELRERGEL